MEATIEAQDVFVEKAAKQRYPAALAQQVAEEMMAALRRGCARVQVAGSLRRQRKQVGDVEILFIPSLITKPDPGDLFGKPMGVDGSEVALRELIARGIISKRKNVKGSEMWGEKNRLAMHVETGIPIDFFATDLECWANYLVCRTGGATSNMEIATRAKAKNWKWQPYKAGFVHRDDLSQVQIVRKEEDVFNFVEMEFVEPALRL